MKMKYWIVEAPEDWSLSRPCVGCHLSKPCEELDGKIDCPFEFAKEASEVKSINGLNLDFVKGGKLFAVTEDK